MNGKERIMTALELGQPDMVPIWEMGYNVPAAIGIAKHFMDAEKLPEPKLPMDMTGDEIAQYYIGLITFIRELDLDGVTLFQMPRGSGLMKIIYRIPMA